MRKRKEIQLFTVRNKAGQFIGSYRAFTAEQAIDRLIQDQLATASHFKCMSMPKREDFTASVEERR